MTDAIMNERTGFEHWADPDLVAERGKVRQALEALSEVYARLTLEVQRRSSGQEPS